MGSYIQTATYWSPHRGRECNRRHENETLRLQFGNFCISSHSYRRHLPASPVTTPNIILPQHNPAHGRFPCCVSCPGICPQKINQLASLLSHISFRSRLSPTQLTPVHDVHQRIDCNTTCGTVYRQKRNKILKPRTCALLTEQILDQTCNSNNNSQKSPTLITPDLHRQGSDYIQPLQIRPANTETCEGDTEQ